MVSLLGLAMAFLTTMIIARYLFWFGRRNRLRVLATDTFAILNKHNIDYWADCGTLLGITREGDIILEDDDVDVSVPDTPENRKAVRNICKDVEDLGYVWRGEIGYEIYRIYSPIGLHTDIYFMQEATDHYKHHDGSNPPKALIGKPVIINWEMQGVKVRVPEHSHKYLAWRYGEDYMTPRPGHKGRG